MLNWKKVRHKDENQQNERKVTKETVFSGLTLVWAEKGLYWSTGSVCVVAWVTAGSWRTTKTCYSSLVTWKSTNKFWKHSLIWSLSLMLAWDQFLSFSQKLQKRVLKDINAKQTYCTTNCLVLFIFSPFPETLKGTLKNKQKAQIMKSGIMLWPSYKVIKYNNIQQLWCNNL